MKRRLEAGVGTVTLGAGDGTLAVTFERPFGNVDILPSVVVNFAQALGAGKRGWVAATSITTAGFTITIDSDSAEGTLDVSWIATMRRPSEKADF